jgi:hypothetical protein
MVRHATRISRELVVGIAHDTIDRVKSARRAWQLLHLPVEPKRIPEVGEPDATEQEPGIDRVEQASIDSFPASDAPGWIGSAH